MKSTQTIRVTRGGKVIHVEHADVRVPVVEPRDPTGFQDLKDRASIRATACIYCGSTERLSREHVAPYALGGTVTIIDGSCEACRLKTHAFETDVLTGPMRMVRYLQKMPSRSKHRDIPQTVPVTVTLADGTQQEIHLPIEEAPILLAFSEFAEPKYLDPSRGDRLEVRGVTTGSYGVHPDEVTRKLGISGLSLTSPPTMPHPFARMVAKIAYGYAYVEDFLRHIERPEELVQSFMDDPNTLGRFIGTMDPPFESYAGMSLRLSIKIHEAPRVAVVHVQLFAHSDAPTYVVILGRLKADVDIGSFSSV